MGCEKEHPKIRSRNTSQISARSETKTSTRVLKTMEEQVEKERAKPCGLTHFATFPRVFFIDVDESLYLRNRVRLLPANSTKKILLSGTAHESPTADAD